MQPTVDISIEVDRPEKSNFARATSYVWLALPRRTSIRSFLSVLTIFFSETACMAQIASQQQTLHADTAHNRTASLRGARLNPHDISYTSGTSKHPKKKVRASDRIQLPRKLPNYRNMDKRQKSSVTLKSTHRSNPIKSRCLTALKDVKSPILILSRAAKKNLNNPQQMTRSRTNKNKNRSRFISKKSKEQILGDKTDLQRLLKKTNSACSTRKKSRRTLSAIKSTINTHSYKIGVILPLTGESSNVSRGIIIGLKAAKKENSDFHGTFIIRDSKGTTAGARAALAELVLADRISLLITGLTHIEAQSLLPLTKRLMIPTLIVNSDRFLIAQNKYAFQVFPQQSHQAKRLAEEMQLRGITKVAIFEPLRGGKSTFTRLLSDEFKALNISIHKVIQYLENDFESMERAVKIVAGINYVNRREEFTAIYDLAKKNAEKEGYKFDAKSVVLAPKMQVDAVVIPDNFRMVRHFAKIFKFHNVPSFTFIGTHEWRSPALINPWDSFLAGSFFVDIVGNYNSLPQELVRDLITPIPIPNKGGISALDSSVGTHLQVDSLRSGSDSNSNSNFTSPEMTQTLDFKLVGYRTGEIAIKAIGRAFKLKNASRTRNTPRSVIAGILSSSRSSSTGSRIFDRYRSIKWPAHIFSIENHRITLKPSYKYAKTYIWEKKVRPGKHHAIRSRLKPESASSSRSQWHHN